MGRLVAYAHREFLLKILVVDDHPAIRRLVNRALSERGHLVTVVASAQEAMNVAALETYDCALLDVELGDEIAGFEIAKALLIRRPRLRITMMSGDWNNEGQADLIGSGKFLKKPFTLSELLDQMAV